MAILDDEPLNGAVGIERVLYPAPVGQIVDEVDYSGLIERVRENCGSWGGAFNVLAPAARGSAMPAEEWVRVLRSSTLDGVSGNGVIQPSEEPHALSTTAFGVTFLDSLRTDPSLLTILAWSRKTSREDRVSVLDARLVPVNNPWHLAYLGVWGSLPESTESFELQLAQLAADATYSSVLRFNEEPFEPGGAHLLASLRRSDSMPAVSYSTCFLANAAAALGGQFNEDPTLPIRRYTAADFGPNVVVIYEPGNVTDLCILWQLRASSGLNRGLPLAIPVSEDAAAVLQHWLRSFAHHSWGLRDLKCALVSSSVAEDRLREIASVHPSLEAARWQDVVRPAPGCGLWSSAVANFIDGVAKIPAISEVGDSDVTREMLQHAGMRLRVRVSVHGRRLPSSEVMNVEQVLGPRYNGGAIVSVSTRRNFVDVRYPTGLDVLHAVVQDHGLRCRLSTPGRIASQLVSQIGSVSELVWLCSPSIIRFIESLSTRRGQAFLKRRLATFLDVSTTDESSEEILALVIGKINLSLGAPEDDDDRSDVGFSAIKAAIGSREGAIAWLDWAERRGLLLRGSLMTCAECHHKGWRPMSDIAPPIICRGCSREISSPYKQESLNYRYRASEVLIRAHSADVTAHLLAQRYIEELFGSAGSDSFIYGGYPGIEFLDDSGAVAGEADVLFVTMDGGLIVGECKTRAGGLIREELEKLWILGEKLDATATFVATLDSSEKCSEVWKGMNPSGRKHFALTAEHLYEFNPFNAVGTDPLAWRAQYRTLSRFETDDESKINQEFDRQLTGKVAWENVVRRPPWRQSGE